MESFSNVHVHLGSIGAQWQKSNDAVEAVTFKNPSRELEIYVDLYNGETKNYFDPFIVFEDDGLAIHIGHFKTFLVDPTVTKSLKVGTPSSKKIVYRFSVEPGFFKTAVHEGVERSLPIDPSEFLNQEDIDAYVYFGNLRPTLVGTASVLMDRRLPQWVQNLILSQMKVALHLYTQIFQYQPEVKPNVILNWNLNGYREGILGTTYEGIGARTMFFTLMNKKAEPTDRTLELKLLKLVYHELGHFWNINKEGDSLKSGWMIEGGNEAVTWRAMRITKVVSAKEFEATYEDYYQKCKTKYRTGMILSSPGKRDDYSIAYSCGFLVGEVTERLLSDHDLIGFWRMLLDQKRKRGDKYTIDEYFELLAKKSRDLDGVLSLRKWIEQPQQIPAKELDRLLARTKGTKLFH